MAAINACYNALITFIFLSQLAEMIMFASLCYRLKHIKLAWFKLTSLALITAMLMALSGCASHPDSSHSAPSQKAVIPAPLPITAKDAASHMGRGFNLGQMFDNTQHPRTFAKAKAKIDAYYNMGFRNVRLPITWTEVIGDDLLVKSPTSGDIDTANPRLMVIEQIIDYALSLPDMYVVINAHHERRLKTQNRWQVLQNLWGQLATRYVGKDYRLMYEILNEPHLDDGESSPMDPALTRHMIGRSYDRIRSIDPQRILIFGGNQWFGYEEVPDVWTNLDDIGGGSDNYLMTTFHHYNPWEFNGDNQGNYDDEWTDFDIYNPMDVMAQWADTVGGGMPVYIGEWGVGWNSVLPTMECNNIRLWYSKLHTEYAEPRNMPTAVWDDGGWFTVFDHKTDSFNNNLAQCINGECDWTGDERFNNACSL